LTIEHVDTPEEIRIPTSTLADVSLNGGLLLKEGELGSFLEGYRILDLTDEKGHLCGWLL